MRLRRIINSLLENDMYKFSMGQAIYHQFPTYETGWTFKCRNEGVVFTSEMVEEIKEQIKAYCELRFAEDELEFLAKFRWIKCSYVNFLRLWHPRYEDFTITTGGDKGLTIETYGTWLNTSMYEVPVLAIVNEVYFRMAYDYDMLLHSAKDKLDEKIEWIGRGGLYCLSNFSEFGLRRRLSADVQEMVVKALAETQFSCSTFVGTSNVHLAKKFGLTPVGTMAHEWIMCVGQGNPRHNPAYSNYYAMHAWIKEYGTKNGIALTDTLGTDLFLRDFDDEIATLFSGVRHDSGDPFAFGDKFIDKYKELGINPKTKTLLFSDGLDFRKADELFRYFNPRINVAFGIGTYLSNDTCVEPLNIVMKVTKCNGTDVAKISDTPGKGMCKNPEYVEYLKRCIDWRINVA